MRRFALAALASLALLAPAHAADTAARPGKPTQDPLAPAHAADTLVMKLAGGDVVIALRPDIAPKHVARVKQLVAEKFYDNIVFHRVIADFMAQTGDPTGTGSGGSTYPDLPAEFSEAPFKRGTIGAARADNPDSANSQFFFCFTDQSCAHLQGQYTVWGQVVSGMAAIDAVKKGEGDGGLVTGPDKIISMRLQAGG